MDSFISPHSPPPGLLRRLGVMFYDGLVLLALLLLLSLPYSLLTGGQPPGAAVRLLYQLYLLAICFLYFGWFWVHGGQTLGLRSWRLKLVRTDGGPVTWSLALRRFAWAWLSLLCLGLGFLWVIFERDKLTWHDRLSGTKLIRLPKA